MKKNLLVTFLFITHFAVAQQVISGHVYEISGGKYFSIPGTIIRTLSGNAITQTDTAGFFSLQMQPVDSGKIVASMTGFMNDTVYASGNDTRIFLKKSVTLNAVQVTAKREDLAMSTTKAVNSEIITSNELLKAACCNLSEAFETNPSVNVAYKDAVTGVKEIQLLGLGGTYVQMQSENIPDMRGLAGVYGLTFIPGPWIESIQLSKGSGSVINGYESTTGQINIEYKKPFDKDQPRFLLNLFGDERGGLEANSIVKKKIATNWSSMLMLHGRWMQKETDRNGDGFMDSPGNKSINIYNRWNYHDNRKMEGQINLKFLDDEIKGGQMSDLKVARKYETSVMTKRAEVSGKLGFLFPGKPFKSIGNILLVSYHNMNSFFGDRIYNADESSFYFQSIYQNILWKSNHQYKTGITYRANILNQEFSGLPGQVRESIPGVFFEYTYNYTDKLTIIAGAREDFVDAKTWLFTPRIHGKYNFTEHTIVRFSAGRSYRTPYLIADHMYVLASSRQIDIAENILAEGAKNYGANITTRFEFANKEFTLSADAYRTDFINQLTIDSYSDSTKIIFSNLHGKSYSNSLQVTLNAELMETLNLRLSYKMDDVKSTYNGILEEKPLSSRERFLATLSASTSNEHLKFDYTFVLEGKKRLQFVYTDDYNTSKEFSPSFYLMNFQVTKVFKRFDVYGGAENILDYRQKNPIINPDNPFGNSFDATNIWGPVEGRRIYLGLRYSIR
jgi:outer membrane receptor for ferrienterochelin and colicins